MNLITWETYTKRREIKALWWKWSKEDSWWIIDWELEKINELMEKYTDLEIEEIEDKDIKTLSKIDYQINKAERKVEMYSNRIIKAQGDFKNLDSRHDILTHWRDYAFITQPCNWNKSMIRAKEKVEQVMEKKYWEWWAVDRESKANEKLEYWKEELQRLKDKKAWKWLNAKQKRDLLIEKNRNKFKVWDKVKCHLIKEWYWIISKINKKTCKLEWYTFNIELHWVYKV